MDKRTNPFTPGAGTQPPELTGREGVLETVSVTLDRLRNRRHERSQMLIGLRGVGKTVLLNRIDRLASEAGFYTAFIEAPENRSIAEILAPELRKLLLKIDTVAATKDKVHRALGALRSFASVFKVNIGDVAVGISAPSGVSDSGNLDRDLIDLLVTVGEAAAENNTVIAILIDELQYLKNEDFGALISGLHRISQLNLPLVLFGAGLPQLAGLAGNAKSYAERLFIFDEIGQLPVDDAKEALEGPVRRMGVSYTPEALNGILAATERYPYFLQEWGKQSWLQAKGSPITIDDVIASEEPAISELDRSFFRVRFDRLTPAERDYLRAMAQLGPDLHRSGSVADVLGRAVEEVAPIRAKVITKGMAFAPAHGDIAFTVPKFDGYMVRAMPNWTPRIPKKRKGGDTS